MALVPAVSEGAIVELDVGKSVETLAALLDSQRELFHSQIDHFQKLVVAQCKLTGVNPLSQEMEFRVSILDANYAYSSSSAILAAGALSIKIGKKPRDLLNPKAVNYMQSVFSVKDTIGKKETREISALCGITVTQVREFFAAQRSRSISAETMIIGEQIPVPESAMIINSLRDGQQDTLISTDLKNTEEGPSCTALEETYPGIDSNDKKFMDNIFNLMRKEETFSGQLELTVFKDHLTDLRTENSLICTLFCVQAAGALSIKIGKKPRDLLNPKAVNYMQSVFSVKDTIGKKETREISALCGITVTQVREFFAAQRSRSISAETMIIGEQIPVPESAMIINSLRDGQQDTLISTDLKNTEEGPSCTALEETYPGIDSNDKKFMDNIFNLMRKEETFSGQLELTVFKDHLSDLRISEILSDESWHSKIDVPVDILALNADLENNRKSESKQAVKLLPSSTDALKTKERRKVLLVEQPDCKTSARSVQNKYGKADTSSSENKPQKTEHNRVPSPSQTSNMLSMSRAHQLPPLGKDEATKASISTTNIRLDESETLVIPRPNTTSQEQLLEKLKCSQIQWQTPPEIILDSEWCVGIGKNSKEVEVQTYRNRREKETFYSKPEDIPLNPKEPWDLEMDFDDSLTPEIPTEPPPDADIVEDSSCSPCNGEASIDETPAAISAPPPIDNGNVVPDLELLTVLLKNPELVFALTSGQAKSMTSEEMVALLDVLKKNGVGVAELVTGAADCPKEKPKEPEPTSLPSPTPPSDPAARAAWRSEFPVRRSTPVLQPYFPGSRVATLPTAAPHNPSPAAIPPVVVKTQDSGLGLPPRIPTTTISSISQSTVTINATSQHHPSPNFLPKGPPAPSAHQIPTSIYPLQHSSVPDSILPTKQYPITNVPSASPSVPRQEASNHSPSPLTTHPTLPRPQPPTFSSRIPAWPPGVAASAASVRRPNPTPEPWIGRSNAMSEASVPSQRFLANQINYNAYAKGPVFPPVVPPGDRYENVDGSQVETWSTEGSPVRLGGRNYSGTMRDHGRHHRPEWPRQWDPGNRDRHRSGGKQRWQDRGRDWRR
ncbi:homeobox protein LUMINIDEPENDENS-like [Cocos nucifera]|uniref:Homeobox protein LUMINIDEPENDENS-like n=1 Tax=Cocos nucifera TaxID=13894 RepID=A0A8K0IY05_COCNU|nr:homeobox protein LUMINIDEPENDENS-like [Cocos nucifera]